MAKKSKVAEIHAIFEQKGLNAEVDFQQEKYLQTISKWTIIAEQYIYCRYRKQVQEHVW